MHTTRFTTMESRAAFARLARTANADQFLRFSRWLLLLGCICLLTCAADPRIVISVKVSGLPTDITALYVSADLDGQHAETQITQNLEAFAFYLPDGALGKMKLRVQALGSDGCSTAFGSVEADTVPGSVVEVSVELTALSTKLCPVRITRLADATDNDSVVLSNPAGIKCGAFCTAFFPINSLIDLSATPRLTTLFLGFSGNPICQGSATCRLPVSAAIELTAQFSDNVVTVSSAEGQGRVTSFPAGIDCPGRCAARFPVNTVVTLTAAPTIPGKIGRWSGACDGYTTCQITVRGAVSPSLEFVDNLLTLAPLSAIDARIVSDPPGISCGTTCSAAFPVGTSVILTAEDKNGAIVNWSTPCNTGPMCKVTIDQPTRLRTVRVQDSVCVPGQLCQVSQRPIGANMTSVWSSSSREAWFVGSFGAMAHWKDGYAESITTGTTRPLTSVHGSSPTNVWAVGYAGTVLRYDGVSLQPVPTGGVTYDLSDVWAFSDNDVWIVGSGNALHWDGTQLQAVTEPLLANCGEIIGISPQEIWAIGPPVKMVRYLNGTATQLNTGVPSFASLRGLSGTSANDIWVGDSRGIATHYDGTSWVSSVPLGAAIAAISANSSSNVWAAVGEGLARFDGTKWLLSPYGAPNVVSMSSTGPNNLWLVGSSGRILHWDGQGLLDINGPLTYTNYTTIGGTSDSNVLVLGQLSRTLLHNGTSWSRGDTLFQISPASLFAISPTEAYVVDKRDAAKLARWDGQTWRSVPFPFATPEPFNALAGTSANDIWIGSTQVDYHFDGTKWVTITNPMRLGARGFWINPTGSVVWAIDNSGLRKWTGTSWQRFSLPISSPNGIIGFSDTDIWIVGQSGQIVRFDGATFTNQTSGAFVTLTGIWGSRPSSLWVVGALGTILRYNGTSWTRVQNQNFQNLNAVWGYGDKVFMAGDSGTIFSYQE